MAQCSRGELRPIRTAPVRSYLLVEKAMTADSPRLASLRKKLAAREGKSEYKENCEHIRAEIARLEEEASGPEFKL